MNLVQNLEINSSTRVLLRCDLNLPQDESGKFTDFFRLESSLPTIDYLKDQGATIFIMSHLGSPKGRPNSSLSLEPLTQVLTDQLSRRVEFLSDPFNLEEDLRSASGIFLIENLRFWGGEEENSLAFAKELVQLTNSNLFVQDAFGASHRKHASIVGLPQIVPSAAGLLLQKEIASLGAPDEDRLVLIVGGAKVESKLPVILNFIDRADSVLTGGVVANTFLKSIGKNISASLFDQESIKLAKNIEDKTINTKTKLLLPVDYMAAKTPDELLAHEYDDGNLQPDQMILDIGPLTLDEYIKDLENSKTIIWAGTIGFAEKPAFSKGSKGILKEIINLKEINNTRIIIGGGDTVDFVRDNLSQEDLAKIDHISTGGGASLLMLSGEELPGIKALDNFPDKALLNNKDTDNKQSSPLATRTPFLISNLKSHFNLQESKIWLKEILSSEVLTSPDINFAIAPSSLFIEEFSEDLKNNNLKNLPEIYAQDISKENEGSSTGDLAASQLKGIASGTIIGHSERRLKHNETDEDIFNKIIKATDAGLKVILCVGGKSKDTILQKREVSTQLNSVLSNLNSLQTQLITIAYEPVFAIGSGETPSQDFLIEQLGSIRKILKDQRISCKILYGGSVSAQNAKKILSLGFDGLLVGSAGLNPASLEQIGINITA